MPDVEDLSPEKCTSGKNNKESDDIFFVKGPMGKGLQIEERGIHIAFCAGTGVLVYLDLVGHLILRNSLPFIKHNSMSANSMYRGGALVNSINFSGLHLPSSNLSERPRSHHTEESIVGGNRV